MAVPWLSIVNSTTINIKESVGSAALPIMVSGEAVSPAMVTVVQCNGSSLPSELSIDTHITISTGEMNLLWT